MSRSTSSLTNSNQFPWMHNLRTSGSLISIAAQGVTSQQDRPFKEIVAAAYGWHLPCQYIHLTLKIHDENHEQTLLWLQQPSEMTTQDFQQYMAKITAHYEIETCVYLQVNEHEMTLNIQQGSAAQSASTQTAISTDHQHEIWHCFVPTTATILEIQIEDAVKVPKTILGRVARDLNVQAVLEKLK